MSIIFCCLYQERPLLTNYQKIINLMFKNNIVSRVKKPYLAKWQRHDNTVWKAPQIATISFDKHKDVGFWTDLTYLPMLPNNWYAGTCLSSKNKENIIIEFWNWVYEMVSKLNGIFKKDLYLWIFQKVMFQMLNLRFL